MVGMMKNDSRKRYCASYFTIAANLFSPRNGRPRSLFQLPASSGSHEEKDYEDGSEQH
jgi:hypothetical protein